MAHYIKLTDDFPCATDETCRVLEIKAESLEELEMLIAKARKKKWFTWIPPQRLSNGLFGVVMEKGMPDFDLDAVLLEATEVPATLELVPMAYEGENFEP